MSNKHQFFLKCYELGIIKFGEFQLKSGIISPFYVDLRPLASVPEILEGLAGFLLESVLGKNFDLICGVPYAALPMATAMSLKNRVPLIIKRKEAKKYGTKKTIEGIYKAGQRCLVVEDVITSGKSLMETIPEIESEGLKVQDIVVVLDREQGGAKLLQEKGYNVHIVFTITEICEILRKENLIDEIQHQKIIDFLNGNSSIPTTPPKKTYEQKLEKINHPFGEKFLKLALEKQTNLIASADVTKTAELLKMAELAGPHIVALKTHIDIITDFGENTISELKKIAGKHRFFIMEDRKFADIGHTQNLQFSGGIYKIANWADCVTSHVIGGYKSLDAFGETPVIAILSMSSEGTLASQDYLQNALPIAEKHPAVFGGVSQFPLSDSLLLFSPGVNLADVTDGAGQQYNTPEYLFREVGTDFIIVGRGIFQADTIADSAEKYKTAGWNAYLEACKTH